MIPYLLLMIAIPSLSSVIQPKKSYRRKLLFTAIIFFAAALLAAMRDVSVGADTRQYWNAYSLIGRSNLRDLSSFRYEYGYTLMCWLLNKVSANPQLLLAVTSFFPIACAAILVIRFSSDAALSAFLFIGMNYYAMYMTALRQAMAVGFVIIALLCWLDKKYPLAVVFSIVAMQFHQTALLAIVLYPLILRRYPKHGYTCYVLIAAVAFILSNNLTVLITNLLGKSQFYDPAHSGSNYFGALIQLAFYLVIASLTINYLYIIRKGSLWDKGSFQEKKFNLYANALMLSVLFYALGVKVEVLSRLAMYFNAVVILALPDALAAPKAREGSIVRLSLILIVLAYWLIIAVYRPEWHGVIPYMVSASVPISSVFL